MQRVYQELKCEMSNGCPVDVQNLGQRSRQQMHFRKSSVMKVIRQHLKP